jgi:hypothetical protein
MLPQTKEGIEGGRSVNFIIFLFDYRYRTFDEIHRLTSFFFPRPRYSGKAMQMAEEKMESESERKTMSRSAVSKRGSELTIDNL